MKREGKAFRVKKVEILMQGLTPHGFPGWVAGASLTLRNYTFFLLHSESRRTTEKVMGSCNAGTFPCHVWRCTFNLPRVGIHSQGLRCVAHLPQGLSSQQNCLCLNCLKKQFYWPVSSWFLSSLFFWLFLSSYFYCSRMSTVRRKEENWNRDLTGKSWKIQE